MAFFRVLREFTDVAQNKRIYPFQVWEGTDEATIASHQLGGIISTEEIEPPTPPETITANP